MAESKVQNSIDSENLRIGRQIRDLRKAKGVTISTMAETVGKSVGYISQVERGVSALPIPVLQRICDLLGVQISWFFHSDSQTPVEELNHVVRKDNRRSLSFAGTGIREELLSPRMSGQLQMILTTFAPGAGHPEPRQRKGEEGGYVQSGSLELTLGEQQFMLNTGDSFSLDGDEPHLVCNPSETEDAVVVWMMTPAGY